MHAYFENNFDWTIFFFKEKKIIQIKTIGEHGFVHQIARKVFRLPFQIWKRGMLKQGNIYFKGNNSEYGLI